MTNARSPNCPTLPLLDALEKGRRVYIEEHTHAANRDVIAKDMGYSSLSGPAGAAIGALRQYGILEGRGEEMHISDDAVTVFELPDGSRERSEALHRMAYRPPLFQELHNQFGNRLPGEANLRHLLIKRGFLPDRADDVIRTYRENLELIGIRSEEYNSGQEQIEMPATMAPPPKPLAHFSSANAISPPSAQTYAWPLSGTVKASLQIDGEPDAEDLDLLRDYIEIAIKALKRRKTTE